MRECIIILLNVVLEMKTLRATAGDAVIHSASVALMMAGAFGVPGSSRDNDLNCVWKPINRSHGPKFNYIEVLSVDMFPLDEKVCPVQRFRATIDFADDYINDRKFLLVEIHEYITRKLAPLFEQLPECGLLNRLFTKWSDFRAGPSGKIENAGDVSITWNLLQEILLKREALCQVKVLDDFQQVFANAGIQISDSEIFDIYENGGILSLGLRAKEMMLAFVRHETGIFGRWVTERDEDARLSLYAGAGRHRLDELMAKALEEVGVEKVTKNVCYVSISQSYSSEGIDLRNGLLIEDVLCPFERDLQPAVAVTELGLLYFEPELAYEADGSFTSTKGVWRSKEGIAIPDENLNSFEITLRGVILKKLDPPPSG